MNRNTKLTAEAFQELASSSAEELYENSDTYETHDLRTWCKKLIKTVARQALTCANELESRCELDSDDE